MLGPYRKPDIRANEWISRYYVGMRKLVIAALAVSGSAHADSFGGFAGVTSAYLVTPDRVCEPLEVKGGAASGAPSCDKQPANEIAKLSIKPPVAQRGAKALFAASASGKTLTVTSQSGDAVVTWEAGDAITKVVEVYAAQYGDRVAVAYAVRRLGREVTDVVGFKLVKEAKIGSGTGSGSGSGTGATNPPEDPKLTAAVEAARKKNTKAAWDGVLAIDADNAEARFRLAALAVKTARADAMNRLDELAKSSRGDAIEWLVEARFDPAFAALRADPKFRAAVGLDRKAATSYERLMGFGGQWMQNGTSCDKPEVHVRAKRDRSIEIRVKSACEGMAFDQTFKGTWRLDGDAVVLVVPTRGKQVTQADEGRCRFEAAGDEDALHCGLGRDVDFVVLPTRR
jgi:hypothetical protein